MFILNNKTLTLKHLGIVYSKMLSEEELIQVKVFALDDDIESIIKLCFPTSKDLLLKEGFWKENGSIYYKNIKISIPQVLAETMMKANDEELKRLINFWCWLSLNPNPRSREDLYTWIEKNGIQLTNKGLMILYRRVYRVTKVSPLTAFVKETYEKLRKQKKSTNVDVFQCSYNGNFALGNYGSELTQPVLMGNLKELYHSLPDSTIYFTDAHTRKKRYLIGVEEREPRALGDEDSSVSCSRGLHMSGKNFAYEAFGDTPIAVLVNPMDVLAVPDSGEKIRSCAMTPIAVLNEDAEWADDKEVHLRVDAVYDNQVNNLEKLLSEAQFEDFKKHEVLENKWNLSVGFETVLNILNKTQ